MDEIEKILDSGNYKDMYLSDTEVVKEPPKKKPTGILNIIKYKISKLFNYLYK